jgi:hypothetical protein
LRAALVVLLFLIVAYPYVRGHLPHLLLANPLHQQLGRAVHLELDTRRRGNLHGVVEADRQQEIVPLHLGPIPHALHLEGLGEPLADADHHVGYEAAGEPVLGPVALLIRGSAYQQLAIGNLQTHLRGHLATQLPLGSLYRHLAALNQDVDAAGNGYWHLSYT